MPNSILIDSKSFLMKIHIFHITHLKKLSAISM
jgi:hypothetical protein